MRVLDNPGNKLRVTPYGIPNNSRKIGFEFYKGSFKETAFPDTITQNDVTLKNHYLNANDLLESSMVTKHTVSKERFVEVYRINEKPTSITDFDGFLRSTVDLRFLDTDRSTKNFAYMHDMVIPNRKYYYCARSLDVHNNISNPTYIFEIEMVNNDGQIFLRQDIFTFEAAKPEVVKNGRRFIYVEPSFNQVVLEEPPEAPANVNVAPENNILGIADQQESCWNETFKIRVTSKKTGKKLDLNLTFKNSGVTNPS